MARAYFAREALCEPYLPVSREVHREEADVGAYITAAKPIAVLEAVDDREIAVASKVHVLEPQVAVAVAYATLRKPTLEDPRAITKEVELPPLHLACDLAAG